MAALTATDWTIAEVNYPHERRIVNNGIRVVQSTMTLASAGTYPSGGIPIPTTPATWGLKNELKHIQFLEPVSADGNIYKYSVTGDVIRIYQDNATTSDGATAQGALAEMATTATAGTGGGVVLYVEAFGS